jgi:hypothetical protein
MSLKRGNLLYGPGWTVLAAERVAVISSYLMISNLALATARASFSYERCRRARFDAHPTGLKCGKP